MISWERIVEVRQAHRQAWAELRRARREGGGIPADVAERFMVATEATAELFRELGDWFDRPQFPGEEL